jgi:hypothetical protein
MTPFEQQLKVLQGSFPRASARPLPSGAQLVSLPDYELPSGWSQKNVTIHFLAPPGFPAARPDCFWVEPVGLRLEGGGTPANTNDSNPIPEVGAGGPTGTWFSWHIQNWNPNQDGLITYVNVIRQRLKPPR